MNEFKKRFVTLVKMFNERVETVDGRSYYAFDDDENHAAFREQLEEESGIPPTSEDCCAAQRQAVLTTIGAQGADAKFGRTSALTSKTGDDHRPA